MASILWLCIFLTVRTHTATLSITWHRISANTIVFKSIWFHVCGTLRAAAYIAWGLYEVWVSVTGSTITCWTSYIRSQRLIVRRKELLCRTLTCITSIRNEISHASAGRSVFVRVVRVLKAWCTDSYLNSSRWCRITVISRTSTHTISIFTKRRRAAAIRSLLICHCIGLACITHLA